MSYSGATKNYSLGLYENNGDIFNPKPDFNKNMEKIDTQMKINDDAIAAVAEKNTEQEGAITTLTTKVTALETSSTSQGNAIARHEIEITDLKSDIAEAKVDIENLKEDVKNADLSMFNERLTNVENAYDNLEIKVNELQENLNNVITEFYEFPEIVSEDNITADADGNSYIVNINIGRNPVLRNASGLAMLTLTSTVDMKKVEYNNSIFSTYENKSSGLVTLPNSSDLNKYISVNVFPEIIGSSIKFNAEIYYTKNYVKEG